MEVRQFDSTAGLEEVEHELARASRHPVHVDLGEGYDEGGVAPLGDDDARDRLAHVEPMDDLHVIWDNRADERAYVGSKRYNLVQHREVIDAIREAVSRTAGDIEKGGVRDHGDHVDGVIVFGNQDEAIIDVGNLVGDGYVPPEGPGVRDTLGLGMRFHNSFDGRSGFGGETMGYRFICGNWMVHGEETIASRSDYHIKGGEDAPAVPVDYFVDLIDEVFGYRDELAGTVKRAVEEGEVPAEWAPGMLRDAGFGEEYARRITGRVLEQPQTNGETTVWGVYNAATAHLDNDRLHALGPERYDHHQQNAWSLLEGEPESPDEQPDDLEEYAEVPA